MLVRSALAASNFEATPKKYNTKRNFLARGHEIVETVEILAADNDGDHVFVCPLHSSWRVSDVEIMNDVITVGSNYGIGLYDVTENGGAVVAETAYAAVVTMVAARIIWTSLGFQARNIDAVKNQVWQDAGAPEDPDKFYMLALTGTVIGSATGTITVRVRIADGT